MSERQLMKASRECVELQQLHEVRLPRLVSFKMDGIRCLVKRRKILSASMKDSIRNTHVKKLLEFVFQEDSFVFDGELYAHGRTFQEHMSVLSYEDPIPEEMKFCIFDCIPVRNWDIGFVGDSRYIDRFERVKQEVLKFASPRIVFCEQLFCDSHVEIKRLFDLSIEQGYEGLILRDPNGLYKHGRASPKSQTMLKMKNWIDHDAEIIDITEQMGISETASRKLTSTGHLERVFKQGDQKPKGTMGALVVRLEDGRIHKIGNWKGLTEVLRQEIWDNKSKYIGQWVTYKSQIEGEKDLPRIPKDLRFREPK